MPEPTFRGDPYRVLDVNRGASTAEIKRRWRELAREHHPDRFGPNAPETERVTARMARINAAYDLLRDPVRRARFDTSPSARRSRDAEDSGERRAPGTERPTGPGGQFGPPPPPPTRPVTARFDTSAGFHMRNATTSRARTPLPGHPPVDRRHGVYMTDDLRASTPTGPVRRARGGPEPRLPSLADARDTPLEFGRFHGYTLGEVAEMEPTYIDWIARTITRDRDLVLRARVIQADLDERGIEREIRPPRPGFGNPRDAFHGTTGEEARAAGASASG